MKKEHRVSGVGILLVVAIIMAIVLPVASFADAENENSEYTITEPHVYAPAPGSDEWNAYYEPQQKLSACYINPLDLEQMTTAALAETVLTYPLLVNIYAYNDTAIGIDAVSSYFPGLDELFSRADAIDALNSYIGQNISCGYVDFEMLQLYVQSLINYIESHTIETIH